MPTDADAPTPPASDAAPETPAPPETPGTQDADQAIPGAETPQADVYDEAFAQFLDNADGQDSGGSAAKPTPDQPAGEASDPEPPKLTDEQAHLLSRSGMKPEHIEHWAPEDREAFFERAAKREGDQTREFKQLKEQIDQLKQGKGGQGDEQGDSTDPADSAGGDLAKLGESLDSAIESLTDTYGEEMQQLAAPMQGVIKLAQSLKEQLETANAASQSQNRVVVDLIIDKGITDLVTDYPSLSKDKPRAQVEAKFIELWKAEGSPYRTGEGPLLERVRQGIGAAAKSLFGNTTEAAAQAALVDKSKQRLANQPQDGKTKSRPKPKSEDDIYDEAFEGTIGKELRG